MGASTSSGSLYADGVGAVTFHGTSARSRNRSRRPRTTIGVRSVQAKKSRLELARRVETVADTIASLRINSISEHVQELREISREIREVSGDNGTPSLKDITLRALPILTHLFDALGTQQGAEVIIAGAVAGILGAGGWPSVAIYGLTLAAWKGKDAFMAALGKLPKSPGTGRHSKAES
jgi:hypothetical protein